MLTFIQNTPIPNPVDYVGANWFTPGGGGGFDGLGFLRDLASNWTLNSQLSSASELVSQFIYFLSEFINDLFGEIVRFNDSWAGDIANYTTIFACMLIMILTLKQFFTVYVLESEGDSDADPLDVFVRAAEAIALACSGTALFNIMMDFSQTLAKEFLYATTPDGVELAETLSALHKTVTSAPGLILIIVILVGLVLFFITAGIRGAELILMKALFPIFAADKVTTSRDKWNGFFMSYMVTWLSYILQLFSFQMFAYSLQSLASEEGLKKITTASFICLGWMVVMIRAPRWLQRYCYSSGVSNGVSGAARTTLSAVPGLGGR